MTTPNELEKNATALKKSGDLEGAIKLLKKAFEMRQRTGGMQADSLTKYPLYLQAAGRLDEAIVAFSWLIYNAEKMVALAPEMIDEPPFVIQEHTQRLLAGVYEKAALACRRSNRNDLSMSYSKRREECLLEVERIHKIVAMHRERQRAKARNRLQKLKSGEISFAEFDRLVQSNK